MFLDIDIETKHLQQHDAEMMDITPRRRRKPSLVPPTPILRQRITPHSTESQTPFWRHHVLFSQHQRPNPAKQGEWASPAQPELAVLPLDLSNTITLFLPLRLWLSTASTHPRSCLESSGAGAGSRSTSTSDLPGASTTSPGTNVVFDLRHTPNVPPLLPMVGKHPSIHHPCYLRHRIPWPSCRCRGTRARSIGWKPTKTTADMIASIKPEVESLLKW
jgi:hypothetical protein